MTDNTVDTIRRLDPLGGRVTVRPETKNDLIAGITATPAEEQPTPTVHRRVVRRLVPVVATGLIAGLVLAAVALPDDDAPQALAFTEQGGYLVVRIVDLYADTERYNRELRNRGLDFSLRLVPSSPSIVGQEAVTGITESDKHGKVVQTFDDPAGCATARTSPCILGFKVPLDFTGDMEVSIGRPAAPGEQYQSVGQVDGRGEALAGLKWRNRTVADVVEMLRARGVRVVEYRVDERPGYTGARKTVPGDWYVTDGVGWAPGEVLLWASPTRSR